MVKKLQKISNDKKNNGAQMANAVKDSAQQIWLAGLGAFSKAQAEGGKVFEALVKEGTTMQRKTQTVAQDRITEATTRMTGMANDIGSRAAGQWDKLETIFEERVAKSLTRLGVPTSRDFDVLSARIDALAKSMGHAASKTASTPLPKTPSPSPSPSKVAAKTKAAAAKKVPAKKISTKKAPAGKPAAGKTAPRSSAAPRPADAKVVKTATRTASLSAAAGADS